MEKVKIVKKDNISENNQFKYNYLKRILIAIIFLMVVILGFFFLIVDNWFAVLFAILLISIGLFSMLDILFFKALTFYDNCVVKEWFVFGKRKIEFNNLKTSAVKRVWTGTIILRDKRKNNFSQFFMNTEIFPMGNDGFEKIRELLINKNVIKGDENGWNY